ncbi:uncharacterized protein LOC126745822 isoform X2 [Anthonomus grandis grandis]|uniref:uncharacterized protein LOC126745822 isoform X2 n=1 Tax=Anthonomus grandis grandis TaxID=2921223 RepID=UPI00216580F7|nr:uncharacterized protein LOC126745822 isoform X2 [Anthonomus grandis grandis]
MKAQSCIKFHLGEAEHTVNPNDVTPETTLNVYLREHFHLTATKKMCNEGGCGSCIVAVEEIDEDGNKKVFAVNSCLVSIFSCHGWKILTNEGIGNPTNGYHDIQKLLADNNGSQCGFCSSGMVMNMYALLKSGKKLTKMEIEDSFGGNLCRCTGYRPILTAFKKLAMDADMDIVDLEDLKVNCDRSKCFNSCPKGCKREPIMIEYNQGKSQWVKMYNLEDLLEILETSGNKKYMLVAGNTARGVFWPIDDYSADLYIDVTSVIELTSYNPTPNNLVLGANITLTSAMQILRKVAKIYTQFIYLNKMADHIDLVAHVPVRNIGTLAGNLMMKHKHNEFPSDIFLILETANAVLVIVDLDKNEIRVSPENFLKINMHQKVLKQIILPPYKSTVADNFYYTTYKIMTRAQNAHAIVNAGFLYKLSPAGDVQFARIVYGAINPTFVHASKTENYLQGKKLFDNGVLQTAFKLLDQEITPDWVLPDPSPVFRKKLAINLFYKGVLSIAPTFKISERNRSGASLLNRPVSSGTQQIWSNKDLYPLTQPVTKIEALAQTSGQAEYILDKPDLPGQLHGILIKAQSTPGSVITQIDPTKALKTPGVVAFFSAKDIPGLNTIHVESLWIMDTIEEVFCSGEVRFFSQPIGLLVATTHEIAWQSRSLVKVTVTPPMNKPVLSVQQVVKNNMSQRITHRTSIVPKTHGSDVQRVIKGESYINTQYHFHMENQNCLVIPTEDGLQVHAGTQWMDHTQAVISRVLKIPSQKISVIVRRLGGAFGAKLTRNPFCSAAAALAAWKLQKPVSIWMSLSDNMDIIGKRFPLYAKYDVGVNAKGVVQYLEANLYSDFGVGGNEPLDPYIIPSFQNCYNSDTWTFDTYTVKTDLPAFCYTRAPGTLEGTAAIETIMEHIACEMNLDPLDVRKINMNAKENAVLLDFIDDMLKNDDVVKRRKNVELFNKPYNLVLLQIVYNGIISLQNKDEQDILLQNNIDIFDIKRRRGKRNEEALQRNPSFRYLINVPGKTRINVCKKAFLSAYGVTDDRMRRICKLRLPAVLPKIREAKKLPEM